MIAPLESPLTPPPPLMAAVQQLQQSGPSRESSASSSTPRPKRDETEDEEMDELMMLEAEYERERVENIRNNAALLESLGLKGSIQLGFQPSPNRAQSNRNKKPLLSSEEQRRRREAKAHAAALRRAVEPTRRSGRVAAIQQKADEIKDGKLIPSRSEEPETVSSAIRPLQVLYDPIPKQRAPIIPSGPEYEHDGPLPSQPRPGRADDGTLLFEGRWRDVFTPNLTPEDMFRGGAFGGAFFCDTKSNILKAPLSSSDDVAELPFTLPAHLVPTHLTRSEPEGSINRFGVRAGQSLQEWEKAGWIWAQDPRGWAQWYTRFWAGRRTEDDERQIRRWMKVAGPTGRFKNALVKKVQQSGGLRVLGEEDIGRVVRQCLWQWGYELTESEWAKIVG